MKKNKYTRRKFIRQAGSVMAGSVLINPLLKANSVSDNSKKSSLGRQELKSGGGLIDTINSSHAKLYSVNMSDVQWTEGFWAERFKIVTHSMMPHVGDIYMDPEISHAFRNFEIAAGLKEGNHRGPTFHDGDFYKWFEGAASVYALTRDEALDRLMDEIIDVIAKAQAQRDDGYIFTRAIIDEKQGVPNVEPLTRRFETYNLGHLQSAAVAHYRVTGKTNFLNVAIKVTDFLYDIYKNDPVRLASNSLCPAHYMGVPEMYRTTQDPRYLVLAKGLINIREMSEGAPDGRHKNQESLPFREQREAIGHAVRGTYLYAGAADVYLETGDESLWTPLESIWNDLVTKKIYITGASGALYDGTYPDGTINNRSQIEKIHQAWGRPYQLPNMTAHNETCANIGNILWAWRMLKITGEAEYADVIEMVLYNSLLSGTSLDGKRFLYVNPLRVDDDLPFEFRWSHEREEYISTSNCCPPNVVRAVAQVNNHVYSLSDTALYVNLYGANELSTTLRNGSEIEFTQQTDYPWDGHVRIQLKKVPEGPFSFFLRIPGWANSAELLVNGSPSDALITAGKYSEINRRWQESDIIELNLPMDAKLVEANPLVEETRNQIVVRRGPVVYSMESVDFPDNRSIFDVTIPSNIQFSCERLGIDHSDEVVTLVGKALLIENSSWENKLYREVSTKSQEVDIRLIPYYAWGNRGKTEMTVWMPLTRK